MSPDVALGILLVVLPAGLAMGLTPFLLVFLRWRWGEPHPWRLGMTTEDYDAILRGIYEPLVKEMTK